MVVLLFFPKIVHKEHVYHLYWQGNTYEKKKFSLYSVALLFHANIIWQHAGGTFSPSLKCPLKDSLVQRRRLFKSSPFQWPFCINTNAVKMHCPSFFPAFYTQILV